MNKILLVSISEPSKGGAESIQTARYLKYLNNYFEITLLSSKPEKKGWDKTDPSILPYGEGIYKRIEFPIYANVISRIARYKLLPSKLMFPDSGFLFHFLGIKKLRKIRKNNPDIIYSRSTPFSSAILAYKIKKKLNIPWVMHLSDPWAGNPYRDNRLINKDRNWEKKAFNMADLITLTSENAVAYYHLRYPELSSKILYFPNVYDEVNKTPQINFSGKLRIVFTGNLYQKRTLLPFLKALSIVKERIKYLDEIIEIFFAGNFDQNNRKILNENHFTFIKYLGPLDLFESIKLQQSAHVLLSTDKEYDCEIDHVFFLCKILDYIAARKQIIAITDKKSPIFNLLDNNYGKCFDFNEVSLLGDYLIKIIIAFQKKKKSFFEVDNPPDFFSACEQAKRLKSVFDSLN